MSNAVNQPNNSKRVIGRPFPKGVSGNPAGRPKGQSLKEYARDKFAKMTEEQKEIFLSLIPEYEQWKMAEGNPHVTQELEVNTPPIPISDVQEDQRIQKDSEAE